MHAIDRMAVESEPRASADADPHRAMPHRAVNHGAMSHRAVHDGSPGAWSMTDRSVGTGTATRSSMRRRSFVPTTAASTSHAHALRKGQGWGGEHQSRGNG